MAEFVQVRRKDGPKDENMRVVLVPAKALSYYEERGWEEVPVTKQVDVVPPPSLVEDPDDSGPDHDGDVDPDAGEQ